MSIYQKPYTYLIGWSHLNKYYYGVRYSKKCNPADLWVSYFTSSKHVQQLREQEGEPDIKQVRKIFTDTKSAILWEAKVLRRLDVLKKNKWLNMNIAGAIGNLKDRPNPNKGKKFGPLSEETKAKMAEAKKRYYANGGKGPNSGRTMPDDQKSRISATLVGKSKPRKLGIKPSEETRKKMSDSRKRYNATKGNRGSF